MSTVKTSVIIRTFNEGKHLGKLLSCILAQEYKDWEVIIVDSGSSDNTLMVARDYPAEVVVINREDFSFGYSLNVGCEKAEGEYLVFVSAHTYPLDNRWLGNMVKPFQDAKVGMVYGRQIGNERTKISEEKDMRNNFGEKSKILVEEAFGNNANAAIRKSLWNNIPFDEKLPGLEDIDWAHKIQKRDFYVYYMADAVICHIHDETYKQIYNRFKREAIAYKTIFPEASYNSKRALINCFLLVLKDLYFGFSKKRPTGNIMTSFPYRCAEFRGWRDGYKHAGVLSQSLKKELFFPRKNRAVVISGANEHQMRKIEVPSLKDDEVLIAVKYVGVCSTDLDVLKGDLEYYKSGWAVYPIIPGHEFSGVIASLGSQVGDLEVGDRVVGECILGCGICESCLRNNPASCRNRKEVGVLNFNGAYCQYLRMPRRFVHKLPMNARLEKACLIEPLAVSIRGVKKLLLYDHDGPKRAAVLGFGTIGNLCAQLMIARDHQVVVFDRNELKLATIPHIRIKANTRISGLENFDYIIEATGRPEPLKKALCESGVGARILLLGLPYSAISFNFESIVSRDKTLIGSVGSTRAEFAEAIATYEELNLDSLVQSIFPFEDYEAAWDKHRSGAVTKAIIKVGDA